MMGNRLKITALLLVFVFFSLFFHSLLTEGGIGQAEEEEVGMEGVRKRRHPIVETAMSLFSLPTTLPDTSRCWTKLDSLIRGSRDLFSNPNLDFRGNGKAGEEGKGEKVKEAVINSMDKSKATLEESAKSAAKMAGEAVDKAAKKLKKTLSDKDGDHHPPIANAEL